MDQDQELFQTALKSLLDRHALSLLLTILSNIIQDPNDARKQDLNHATICKKLNDSKQALAVLKSVGFTAYTDADKQDELRLKIDVNEQNIHVIKSAYHHLLHHSMDLPRIYRGYLDCRQLMRNHPPQFQDSRKQFVFNTVCPNAENDCFGTLSYARYRCSELPSLIDDPTDFLQNRLVVKPNIFEYVDNAQEADNSHFYVNFADTNLFAYYKGPLFAQDEIMVAEHPILASLREKLVRSNDPKTMTPNCRNEAVVICDALKHGLFEEKALSKIYGNRFRMADQNTLKTCLKVCQPAMVDNIICIAALMSSGRKYKRNQLEYLMRTAYAGFNGAKCETLHRSLHGETRVRTVYDCDHTQLLQVLQNEILTPEVLPTMDAEDRQLFLQFFVENKLSGHDLQQMTRKEFGAKMVQFGGKNKLNGAATKVWRMLKGYEKTTASTSTSVADANENANGKGNNDEDEKKPEANNNEAIVLPKLKRVVVHTGNWGCGAFGGNLELHAILQFVAAVAANVDEMWYHAVDANPMEQVYNARDVLLEEIYPNCKDKKGKMNRDALYEQLLQKGYLWGRSNGT